MMFRVSGLEDTKKDTSKLTKTTGLFYYIFYLILFIISTRIFKIDKTQFEIPETAFTSLQEIKFS